MTRAIRRATACVQFVAECRVRVARTGCKVLAAFFGHAFAQHVITNIGGRAFLFCLPALSCYREGFVVRGEFWGRLYLPPAAARANVSAWR